MIKQVFRTIYKFKLSSFLTMSSLIISYLGVIVLTFYVSYETSYDKYHNDSDRIYMLSSSKFDNYFPERFINYTKNTYPEIEEQTPLGVLPGNLTTEKLSKEGTRFKEDAILTDSSFFNIVTVKILHGNKDQFLKGKDHIVLSKSAALKMFNEENPIGKSVILNLGEEIILQVVGVFEDMPLNTSIRSNYIISLDILSNFWNYKNWSSWNLFTYIKLKDGIDPQELVKKMDSNNEVANIAGDFYKDIKYTLTPINSIHYSYFDSIPRLTINILIGLICILTLMGAINFINFTTSQASIRSKKLAIIQVSGGSKISAKMQVIIESTILSIMAMCISIVIYLIMAQFVENLFQINGIVLHGRFLMLIFFLIEAAVIGFCTALFPARYITSTPLVLSIKGFFNEKMSKSKFNNILITIQFTTAIVLIAASITMEKQIRYMNTFDIGYDINKIMYVNLNENVFKNFQYVTDKLKNSSFIEDYSCTSNLPCMLQNDMYRDIEGISRDFKYVEADNRYAKFMGLKLVDGEFPMESNQSDRQYLILNESSIKKYDIKKPFDLKLVDSLRVAGIVKDFNYQSLHKAINPVIIIVGNNPNFLNSSILLLKADPKDQEMVSELINDISRNVCPSDKLEVKLLSEQYNSLYNRDRKNTHFIESVALWCLLLGILGLLGMVIFVCRARVKEIGIRKINGSSVMELINRLNKEFLKWLLLAFVIAVPICYFAMDKWLENYAFRMEQSWTTFLLAGLSVLIMALLAISVLTWRAASQNPIKSLKYE